MFQLHFCRSSLQWYSVNALVPSWLSFPKNLFSSKKFIFSKYGKYGVLWFEKNFWSKNFLPSTPNVRSLKDKSEVKILATAFHKVNSNPELPILICLKICWINLNHLLFFFLFCYTIRLTTDFCYLECINSIELWKKKINLCFSMYDALLTIKLFMCVCSFTSVIIPFERG